MTDIVDLHLDQPLEHLRISPWHDPVVDAIGHDPRSTYVERFWLALLGPSTTFLVRHLAAALEAEPEGFDLHLEDTARALGLGHRGGANGPFYRAIARTGQFHITRSAGPGHLSVRLRLQPLTHRQLSRLPERLQAEHRIWMAQHEVPDEEQRRQRARRLALSLLELGETTQAAELQLHRWKVHPALAHDALRWAEARRGAQEASFDQPASTPASVRTPNPVPPLVVSSHAAEA